MVGAGAQEEGLTRAAEAIQRAWKRAWTRIERGQPPILMSEIFACEAAVRMQRVQT